MLLRAHHGTHDQSRRGASSPVIAGRRQLGRELAAAFLAGPWEPEAMAARARRVLGRRPRWLGDGDLAERLELDAGQLAWLADVRGLERTAPEKARNYRYLHVPRTAGPPRVIERPKLRLKEIQRWILRELLVWIPVHPAAHGFVRERSAITHARAHSGRRVVVRLDLQDFFAGVTAARVYGIFRTAGYPESVARPTRATPTTSCCPATTGSGSRWTGWIGSPATRASA